MQIDAVFTDEDGNLYYVEGTSIDDFIDDVFDLASEGGRVSDLVIDEMYLPGVWYFRRSDDDCIVEFENQIRELAKLPPYNQEL